MELAEMQKIGRSTIGRSKIKSTMGMDQLEIVDVRGETVRLERVKGRDEAFNSIIGWSGIQWQSLQVQNKGGKTR